jgi:uncharacterized protein YjiS (DUF1127 family)
MTSPHPERDGFARRLSAPASLAASATLPLIGALPRTGRRSTARQALARLRAALLAWHERVRQRRALGELSDHLLRDIGVSRADALCEATRPFWRD